MARALRPIGLVKMNGELWSARASDNRQIEPGAAVVVVAQKGLTLVVRAEGLPRGGTAPVDDRDDDQGRAGKRQDNG